MSGDVRDLVAAHLAEYPDAGANATERALRAAGHGKSRTAVLAAWRDLTGRGRDSAGSALASRENQYPSPPRGSFGIEGARWDATSLVLPPDLPFETYEKVGAMLGQFLDRTRFALGDWLLYGEVIYGEKYAQAVEATGRPKQTLMNYVSVARRVPSDRRRESLSWSHHRAVAKFDPEEQVRWLDAAEANGWDVEEFNAKLRPERDLPTGVEAVPEVEPARQAPELPTAEAVTGQARVDVLERVEDAARAVLDAADTFMGDGTSLVPDNVLDRLAKAVGDSGYPRPEDYEAMS